jgi:outer membrane immunogenic protein
VGAHHVVRCGVAGRLQTGKFRDNRLVVLRFLIRVALIACATGAVVLTTMNAQAQGPRLAPPYEESEALAKKAQNLLASSDCLDGKAVESLINEIEHYEHRYPSQKYSAERLQVSILIDPLRQKVCPDKLYQVGVRRGRKQAQFPIPSPSTPSTDEPQMRTEIGSARRTWTGFYVGGALGANWSSGSWETTDLRSLGTVDILSDAVKEARATNIAEEIYFGYMWVGAPKLFAGLEADFAYYNALEDPGIPGTGGLPGNKASDSVTMGQKWSASLRGRIGHLVTPSTMIYIAGGPSLMSMNATVNCTGPGVCGTNGIPAFSQTNSTTKVGWTLGGGVETMLWGDWRGRAEYRYADYGTFSTSFGTPAQLALAADIKVHTNTVLLGLSYAFGGR